MPKNVQVPVDAAIVQDRWARRARAAYWSRFWLFLSAVVSWISFVMGPDIEGAIAGVLLTGMTVVEFRVRTFFLSGDERGAIYGWWNQCLFAALFLIYGGYHGSDVTISPATHQMINSVVNLYGLDESDVLPTLKSDMSLCYYTIGLVGAVCQFWLACYYRSARK
jgi:hypothetical protein